MPQRLIAISLLATCASAVLVAQSRYLPDAPGRWRPWQFTADADNRRLLGARPADVKELEAQLLRLTAIIKKTDGFTSPIGFSVETAGSLDLEAARPLSGAGELALTVRPLPALLDFGAYAVWEESHDGKTVRGDSGETAQLLFFVNQLAQPLFSEMGNNVPEFEKLDADVARLAAPQPDVFGIPVYGDTLVLKKSAEPIWAAVTFAETLELVARGIDLRLVGERDAIRRLQTVYNDFTDPKKRDARIAQYKALAAQSKDPAYMDKAMKAEARGEKEAASLLPQIANATAVVTKSEQDLAGARAMAAGLSAADKAAPACYASGDKASLSRFRRGRAPGCDPLVRPNWKLFNPALPRSAPQLLTIAHLAGRCLSAGQKYVHVGGCPANKRLMESIDKAALLAWLQ